MYGGPILFVLVVYGLTGMVISRSCRYVLSPKLSFP